MQQCSHSIWLPTSLTATLTAPTLTVATLTAATLTVATLTVATLTAATLTAATLTAATMTATTITTAAHTEALWQQLWPQSDNHHDNNSPKSLWWQCTVDKKSSSFNCTKSLLVHTLRAYCPASTQQSRQQYAMVFVLVKTIFKGHCDVELHLNPLIPINVMTNPKRHKQANKINMQYSNTAVQSN